MTKSVASSLLKCKSFDSVDMATQFTKRYFEDEFRGYGQAVTKIFHDWDKVKITTENVFGPSKAQFEGSGSYGNGGAMRVSPVGLFAESIDQCIEVACQTAELTHSNKHGYNGAILQALAVFFALNHNKEICQLDSTKFLNDLTTEISRLEDQPKTPIKYDNLEDYLHSKDFTFTHQLDVISDLLQLNKTKSYEESVQNAISKLGHGVSAMEAVPAAVYSFLHNIEKGFKDTMYFAISLGGDTDTIASMACAIAGAYHGLQSIPSSWCSCCESTKDFMEYGEHYFELRKNSLKFGASCNI